MSIEKNEIINKNTTLLNNKQDLETEINKMKDEFINICNKLQKLEECDITTINLKNEIVNLENSLENKSKEILKINSEYNTLKMDNDRLLRN